MSPPAALRVHIEELVVHGLDGLSREALRDAVQTALARHLAPDPSHGWAHGARADRVDAGTIQVRPGMGATGVGEAIAGAVHRGLTAARGPRSGRP